MPDIDIDFGNRDIILSQLKHRVAKLPTGKKHNTGIYATEIPHNPIDNLATVDYKTAEERGYFKLDFLNVSIYKDVRDEAHLTEQSKPRDQRLRRPRNPCLWARCRVNSGSCDSGAPDCCASS